MKHIITIIICLAMAQTIAAQRNIKREFKQFVTSNRDFVATDRLESKDINAVGMPLKSLLEIHQFAAPKKKIASALNSMRTAFAQDKTDMLCYNAVTKSAQSTQEPMSIVTGTEGKASMRVGESGTNLEVLCFLDPADSTNTHRYAYILEWKERNDSLLGRLIVNYARIPAAVSESDFQLMLPMRSNQLLDRFNQYVRRYKEHVPNGGTEYCWGIYAIAKERRSVLSKGDKEYMVKTIDELLKVDSYFRSRDDGQNSKNYLNVAKNLLQE